MMLFPAALEPPPLSREEKTHRPFSGWVDKFDEGLFYRMGATQPRAPRFTAAQRPASAVRFAFRAIRHRLDWRHRNVTTPRVLTLSSTDVKS